MLTTLFSLAEKEALRLLDEKLVLPAYEQILKCSHTFNLLDARGVLGRDDRMANILKIRKLSEKVARGFLHHRMELGFPLLPEGERAAAIEAYQEKYSPVKSGGKKK
jgi:glycyl-tRNA synthetase alpha chain